MNRKQLYIAMALVSPVFLSVACGGMNDTRSQLEQPVEATLDPPMDSVMEPVHSQPSATDTDESRQPLDEMSEAVFAETLPEQALPVTPESGKTASTPPDTLAFYFASNDSSVDQADFEKLIAHAQYLINHPDMRLRLSGHTDQSGSRDYNQWLARQRAEAIARILVEYGVQPSQIQVESRGEDQPVAGLEHAIADRRVELEYTGETQLSEANGF